MYKWWTFLVGLAARLVLRHALNGEAWNQVIDPTTSGGMFEYAQEPGRLKKPPASVIF